MTTSSVPLNTTLDMAHLKQVLDAIQYSHHCRKHPSRNCAPSNKSSYKSSQWGRLSPAMLPWWIT